MIKYPSLPGGFTIFCDDVRREVGGKMTFVGVYSSRMILPKAPFSLIKLYCVINYWDSIDEEGAINIKVILDDNEVENIISSHEENLFVGDKANPNPKDNFVMKQGMFICAIQNLIIQRPGRLKIRAYRGDDEIRLGAIEISVKSPDPSTEAG